MNRQRLLLLAVLLLAAGNLFYYVWRGWGLITIHAQDRPLSEIARSIEKQGHVTLKYDLDAATKVTMNVTRVPVSEALETLSTVTDSRWRLIYVFAADRGAVRGAIASLAGGQKPDDWKSLYFPVPPIGFDDSTSVLPDPRRDTWAVKVPEEHKVQAYLEGAAKSVSASFVFPKSWNPDVNSAPKSGEIRTVAPRLASAAKGQVEELFLLAKNDRGDRGPGDRPDPGDGGGGGFGGGGFRGGGERMQAEIDKLPPTKRAAAQAEADERKAFFAGLRELPPEQRRAKMEELFEKPEVQERMDKMQADRDARRTPQQRVQRAQKYRERKMQVMNGGEKK